jgi:hypothetical protein
MHDLLAAAEREEKELQHKLAAVRALIAAYRGQREPSPQQQTVQSAPQHRSVRQRNSNSDTHELLEKARSYLLQHAARISAKPLLEKIAPERAAQGLTAINAFSSAMSRSPLFDAVRGQGYGLVEWSMAEQNVANLSAVPDGFITRTEGAS